MQVISIKGQKFAYESVKKSLNADVQSILAGCHRQVDNRPLCLCKAEGIPLQVRKLDGVFHLARMPDQGLSHAKDCNFYGETNHSSSGSSAEKLSISFPLSIGHEPIEGKVSLTGLLSLLWTRANLHRWSNKNRPRSWKYVAAQVYKAAHGLNLNNTPVSQLLWVLPHVEDDIQKQISDGCINFVRSCNTNGQFAIIIAPIASSEFFKGSHKLNFRNLEHPSIYVEPHKFPFTIQSLRDNKQLPFPVAIFLAKAPHDKYYLHAHEIALLWMTSSYLPCTAKERSSLLNDLLETSEYLHVPLDIESGHIKPEYAVLRKSGKFTALKSPSTVLNPRNKK